MSIAFELRFEMGSRKRKSAEIRKTFNHAQTTVCESFLSQTLFGLPYDFEQIVY
jgi:hypothetical protein